MTVLVDEQDRRPTNKKQEDVLNEDHGVIYGQKISMDKEARTDRLDYDLRRWEPEEYEYLTNLMQLSPFNFKQLTRTTHIAFGKLCDLLRGDSIFYNNSRHKQIALEIQVAVGLSQLGSNCNGASIGKIQMIFAVGEGTLIFF
ncbi:hypothetical protein PPACK8108_LOCUS5360 [Phakopsora pachyrhizi]|uniref:Uncharacterized protein n=1 Tax=Phakopsora pachyrhizi TaxID=170000 RepID=A0AAV0ARJ2_PHAPC|nr:hypothetical protein PPACK8108_LOCUS5360 [Phakopsora pachyrhizi]